MLLRLSILKLSIMYNIDHAVQNFRLNLFISCLSLQYFVSNFTFQNHHIIQDYSAKQLRIIKNVLLSKKLLIKISAVGNWNLMGLFYMWIFWKYIKNTNIFDRKLWQFIVKVVFEKEWEDMVTLKQFLS